MVLLAINFHFSKQLGNKWNILSQKHLHLIALELTNCEYSVFEEVTYAVLYDQT